MLDKQTNRQTDRQTNRQARYRATLGRTHMANKIQTVLYHIYTDWNGPLSTFLHESCILDAVWKVSEKLRKKLAIWFLTDPPFLQNTKLLTFFNSPLKMHLLYNFHYLTNLKQSRDIFTHSVDTTSQFTISK